MCHCQCLFHVPCDGGKDTPFQAERGSNDAIPDSNVIDVATIACTAGCKFYTLNGEQQRTCLRWRVMEAKTVCPWQLQQEGKQ